MGYIFEAEIESIIHAVRVKTIGEDDDVILKKILTANIHPAIKAYFKAEVEKILAHERGQEYRSKKLPYSLAEVKSLEEQIDLLLVQNYLFSRQEFESILDESVHFQFNYLCRPQWTLLNFIIGDKRRVAASTIEKRLKYCIDYTYFPELIKRYLVDHGLAEVTYEEFKLLIDKIDREVVAQHSSHELAQMTRALFDFVESGKMVPQVEFEQQTLPINAAIVFFEDKQLTDIKTRLEQERDQNRVLQITVDRLADIIEIVRAGKEDEIAEPSLMSIDMPNNAQESNNKTASQVTSDSAEEVNLQESEAVTVVEAEKTPDADGEQPDLFSEDDEKKPETEEDIKRKEIIGLFSQKERRIVLKKIFSNDEKTFQSAVSEISLLNSWQDAAQYLVGLFQKKEIDPFSKAAVLLTDKLSIHFQLPSSKE
ncbi:MAG: hypothetical protein JXA06_12295 [Bacteroidetes bacterium]|nr:hypothetical protein [Bacteroidota bacterium]